MVKPEIEFAPVAPSDPAGPNRDDGTRQVRKPRHFACFDGLRAIAAISVLVLHTAWSSGFTLRSSLGIYASRLEIGVSIFFLISGFLLYRPFVASHLSGRASPNTRRFWERRLLRIVPAYWLALTVLTYGFHSVSLGPGWQGVVTHYLFLQIYFPTQAVHGIPQAWSLCTEMTFYLFLPLYATLVAARRATQERQMAREVVGIVVLIAVSIGFRYWFLHIPLTTVKNGHLVPICAPNCYTNPPFSTLLVAWLPSYLDLFALGMLLAVASAWFVQHDSEPTWLGHRLMPWASWVGAALCFWAVSHVVANREIIYVLTPGINLARQELYGVFAFLLLLPAVFGPQDRTLVRRLLRSWPVASIGVISYGIYLWHLNLIDESIKWMDWRPGAIPFWILTLFVLAVSVGFASASYFGLERPILRLKDRIGWWDPRSQSPKSDTTAQPPAVEEGSDPKPMNHRGSLES